MNPPPFIEKKTVAEANTVDMTRYRWSEPMSAKTGVYVFVLRQRPKITDLKGVGS